MYMKNDKFCLPDGNKNACTMKWYLLRLLEHCLFFNLGGWVTPRLIFMFKSINYNFAILNFFPQKLIHSLTHISASLLVTSKTNKDIWNSNEGQTRWKYKCVARFSEVYLRHTQETKLEPVFLVSVIVKVSRFAKVQPRTFWWTKK